jgi:hypothetical protein
VFTNVPGGVLHHPLTYLNSRPAKGRTTVYEHSQTPFPKRKGDERQFILSSGEVTGALVASHDCDCDKHPKPSQRIIIAPVYAIDLLPPENRLPVLEQRRFSLLPLPDLPGLGTCYADLRLMQAVQRAHLPDDQRIASMIDDAVARLQTQLIAFFSRRALGAPLSVAE